MSNRYADYDEYGFRHLPRHLIRSRRWQDLEGRLTDIDFLEAKTEGGLVFDLASDFAQAVKMLPTDRSQYRILCLLEEAIRRDIYFIARHPTALFQCLWNT